MRWFILFCLATPAQAFESFPEYISLTETEQSLFEKPDEFEPEYQADIIAFTKPHSWTYDFLANPYSFDTSIGSVSAKEFRMNQRLRLRTSLSKTVEFQLVYFDEREYERQDVHLIPEFVIWPWKFLGFNLYGELSYHKRMDDTGLGITLRPSDRHRIRIFQTFVDSTRSVRNDRNDTFVSGKEPDVRGLVGRLTSDPEKKPGEYVQYAVRYEDTTLWRFPDASDEYEYKFWRFFVQTLARKQIHSKLFVSLWAQFDRKFESRTPTTGTSPTAAETWRRDRLFILARANFKEVYQRIDLTAGAEYTRRFWQTDTGQVTYTDILPHFWLSFPAFGTGPAEDRVQVGVASTIHAGSGPTALRNVHDRDSVTNHQLNLSYDFHFKNQAAFRIVATADLDEFGTARTWEGGNAQLKVTF